MDHYFCIVSKNNQIHWEVCSINSRLILQIITTDEAERRGHVYDRQGSTYLFDLDYVEDVYTVDAAHQGNISHFVNHSVSVFTVCTEYTAGSLVEGSVTVSRSTHWIWVYVMTCTSSF